MKFDDLGLIGPILRAVAAKGYEAATPIQIKAIPEVLEGRDLIGCAQTGTGKTAAFALPVLQKLCTPSNYPPPTQGRRKTGKTRYQMSLSTRFVLSIICSGDTWVTR